MILEEDKSEERENHMSEDEDNDMEEDEGEERENHRSENEAVSLSATVITFTHEQEELYSKVVALFN